MKIANIIYENEIINHDKLSYINYYNESIEYDKLDKSLPTLYIGWEFLKKCNPNNLIIQKADILNKKIIGNELYWEFSFEENKLIHVNGVESFVESIPKLYFSSKYNFINLDPVFFQIVDIDDLMNVLPNNIDRLYNYKNDILYILLKNNIWSINLNTYSYFQFDIQDILNRISERSKDKFYDQNGEKYQEYYKIFPNFSFLKRYLVTIID